MKVFRFNIERSSLMDISHDRFCKACVVLVQSQRDFSAGVGTRETARPKNVAADVRRLEFTKLRPGYFLIIVSMWHAAQNRGPDIPARIHAVEQPVPLEMDLGQYRRILRILRIV